LRSAQRLRHASLPGGSLDCLKTYKKIVPSFVFLSRGGGKIKDGRTSFGQGASWHAHQVRFEAQLVEAGEYGMRWVRYVRLNPVRSRLGAERLVDVAKELGYRDGSGVLQVVKRLEQQAAKENALGRKLESLKGEALLRSENVKCQELTPLTPLID
jgi:hypothetical protein